MFNSKFPTLELVCKGSLKKPLNQDMSTFLLNLFHALLNNTINKKKQIPRKKPKVVNNKGGGVKGRYDRGQRINGWFF